jgi:ADP-ribose pyrophosphatase YjhB (NUDIX family)
VLYLDPKVAAGAVIHRPGVTDEVVLVRRAIEPGYGLWVFPGGYVDRGEPVPAAAVREAREECGLEIRLDALLGVYSYAGRTPIVIVYAATWTGGELAPDEESLEARLFPRREVPWPSLAFTSTRQALEDYFAGRLHPWGVR